MCFRRMSIETRIAGKSSGVWKGAQLYGPSCEDVCTIQLVQYAVGFGVSGSAAGMAWMALVLVWATGQYSRVLMHMYEAFHSEWYTNLIIVDNKARSVTSTLAV